MLSRDDFVAMQMKLLPKEAAKAEPQALKHVKGVADRLHTMKRLLVHHVGQATTS